MKAAGGERRFWSAVEGSGESMGDSTVEGSREKMSKAVERRCREDGRAAAGRSQWLK